MIHGRDTEGGQEPHSVGMRRDEMGCDGTEDWIALRAKERMFSVICQKVEIAQETRRDRDRQTADQSSTRQNCDLLLDRYGSCLGSVGSDYGYVGRFNGAYRYGHGSGFG
jgi:hypothetical protein